MILDGSGIDFSKFSSVFGFMSSKWLLHRHNAKKAKVWANCSQNVGFHFPMCLQHCSPAHASLKGMAVPQDSCTQMGRRRWPPPGGVQSAAHRRCAVRAGPPAKSSSAKCQDQSQMANLKGQAHSARLKSYTPLFFSPQEGWDDRNPVTKFAPSAFSGLLNRFFCSSRVCFKNDFEKTSKKLRKS